jgi:hypothetical protein
VFTLHSEFKASIAEADVTFLTQTLLFFLPCLRCFLFDLAFFSVGSCSNYSAHFFVCSVIIWALFFCLLFSFLFSFPSWKTTQKSSQFHICVLLLCGDWNRLWNFLFDPCNFESFPNWSPEYYHLDQCCANFLHLRHTKYCRRVMVAHKRPFCILGGVGGVVYGIDWPWQLHINRPQPENVLFDVHNYSSLLLCHLF